jgi:outer membrane beta-barrel protein
MMNVMIKQVLLCLGLLLSVFSAWAEDPIEVPEEELARETTLPVFGKRRAVLNRSVITERRIEVGAGVGLEMNEPYYEDMMFGAQATYNFNETNALNLQGLFWMEGLSNYGEQLKAGGRFQKFDADKAPHPAWALMANYQFIAYYGKISVTKRTVMNLNLFGLAGLGYLNMDTVNTVAFNVGVGQNFFFTKNFGVRADLRLMIFQGPDATSQRLTPADSPAASAFDDRIYYNTQLALAGIFIL